MASWGGTCERKMPSLRETLLIIGEEYSFLCDYIFIAWQFFDIEEGWACILL